MGITLDPGTTHIDVSWEATFKSKRWTVKWREVKTGKTTWDDEDDIKNSSGSTTDSYTIDGLVPGTRYRVRVLNGLGTTVAGDTVTTASSSGLSAVNPGDDGRYRAIGDADGGSCFFVSNGHLFEQHGSGFANRTDHGHPAKDGGRLQQGATIVDDGTVLCLDLNGWPFKFAKTTGQWHEVTGSSGLRPSFARAKSATVYGISGDDVLVKIDGFKAKEISGAWKLKGDFPSRLSQLVSLDEGSHQLFAVGWSVNGAYSCVEWLGSADGSTGQWIDHTEKPMVRVGAAMGSKFFGFTKSYDLHEYVWHGSKWSWTKHGRPHSPQFPSAPVSLSDSKLMYVAGGRLYERWWNQSSSSWQWASHDSPSVNGEKLTLVSAPAGPASGARMFFFAQAATGETSLVSRGYNSGWRWNVHGAL